MNASSKTAHSFNSSYIGQRDDILGLISSQAQQVLDVGCSTGELGKEIKKHTGASVTGIELSEQMAQVAAQHLDQVIVGNLDSLNLSQAIGAQTFDTIIFADILEHLKDPWALLKSMTSHLKPHGSIVASIPNIRHIDTLFHLVVKGHWPYRDRGIHDRTHLRFFTKSNIIELFDSAGLTIEQINVNYRIIEAPHRYNRFAHLFALPGLKNFLAFQYLIRAKLR